MQCIDFYSIFKIFYKVENFDIELAFFTQAIFHGHAVSA